MDGARTRGHGPAIETIAAMLRGGVPHAVLISGPSGVGKTTLALDLAAGLLCVAPDPWARPCRACRGCRLVDAGTHPDLHWLRPAGPGRQILIGDPAEPSKPRGVRDLLGELALMPLEGGARVAVIEAADRMNEDAQGALLKTLEEPPGGVTIILTADEETRLAPTIRSRCARIRLGPVGAGDVEAVLTDRGVDDPPLAARLARLVGGRPGIALAYARAPDALRIRGELARVVLDLTGATPAERLAAMRSAMPAALAMTSALDASIDADRGTAEPGAATADVAVASADDPMSDAGDPVEVEPAAKGPAPSQRRRAAETLVMIWIDVARDLALVQVGGQRSIRDLDLLDDLERVVTDLGPGDAAASLAGLERATTLLAANVSPELVLDATALAWPGRRLAA